MWSLTDFVSVVKNNLCAVFFAVRGTSREANREAFSIQRAAFYLSQLPDPLLSCPGVPAAGADPEDHRKATEWDNTGSGDFPTVFFVL